MQVEFGLYRKKTKLKPVRPEQNPLFYCIFTEDSNHAFRMLKNWYLSGIIVFLLFSVGCNQVIVQDSGTGILKGKVSIGPLCPVETDPPDPGCLPTEETYKSWPVAVFSADGKQLIAHLQPELDGTYEVEVPAGKYKIDLENHQFSGVGSSNLPTIIEINMADTTRLDIDIDTGIR